MGEMRWRDMESAPKDGTDVLVFVPETGRWHSCRWDREFDTTYDPDDEDAIPRHVGAWTDDAILSFSYEELKSYEPTAWMPLPAPPTEPE